MPRPPRDFASRCGSKTRNPIASWLAIRRNAARLKAEELISDETAKNQATICTKLQSVDFVKSKLPAAVLERKSLFENQKLCDLEMCARELARTLWEDSQVIRADIRKFDQRLLTMVLLFQEAVEHGDTQAAYMAKDAISRAVNDIRSRIPQVSGSLLKQFLEANATYLDHWIDLITVAQSTDRKKNHLAERRKDHADRIAELKKEEANRDEQILKNKDYAKAYQDFLAGMVPADPAKWSPAQKEVYRLLFNIERQKMVVEASGCYLQQLEIQLAMDEGNIKLIWDDLWEIAVAEDPNKLEKFQESIVRMDEKMAKVKDKNREESVILDRIEDITRDLDNAEGAPNGGVEVIRQAQKRLKEIVEQAQ